ncbi:MAG: hypothetical protein H8D56_12225, partial [Planctomycetes bacterium]|nr:hypothetical protein [Planctomycetota bacterium]
MKRRVSNILYLLAFLFFSYSCATEKQMMSKNVMLSAIELQKTGSHYDSLKNAIMALEHDPSNKDARKFILKNAQNAMEIAVKSIDTLPCNCNSLPHIRSQAEDILETKAKLQNLSILTPHLKDVNSIVESCETNASTALISDIKSLLVNRNDKTAVTLINKYRECKLPINDHFTNCLNSLQKLYIVEIKTSLASRDHKTALTFVNKYKECKLPINDDFTDCLNSLQKLYIDDQNIAMILPFIKVNLAHINNDTLNSTLTCLYDPSLDKTNTEKKHQAFEVCLFLNKQIPNNKAVSKKLNEIKNDLFTFIAVLVAENPRGDIIPVSHDKITDRIKSDLDNTRLFVEVISNDCLPRDVMTQDITFDLFRDKRFSEAGIKFDQNVAYLIILEIRKLAIQRHQPIV